MGAIQHKTWKLLISKQLFRKVLVNPVIIYLNMNIKILLQKKT